MNVTLHRNKYVSRLIKFVMEVGSFRFSSIFFTGKWNVFEYTLIIVEVETDESTNPV